LNLDDPAPANEIDENESEDEGIEDYKLGGYHPVHIGYKFSVGYLQNNDIFKRSAFGTVRRYSKIRLGTFLNSVAFERFQIQHLRRHKNPKECSSLFRGSI